jgi:predicted PP-loop superfamily ATPase
MVLTNNLVTNTIDQNISKEDINVLAGGDLLPTFYSPEFIIVFKRAQHLPLL